jgi:hypothetical protein
MKCLIESKLGVAFAGSRPWRTDLEPEDLDGCVAAVHGDLILKLVKCSSNL